MCCVVCFETSCLCPSRGEDPRRPSCAVLWCNCVLFRRFSATCVFILPPPIYLAAFASSVIFSDVRVHFADDLLSCVCELDFVSASYRELILVKNQN